MHEYEARISWARDGAAFTDQRYNRRHEWAFDGGIRVVASASPAVVPLPYSVAEAVDPEEALVACTSSCHMLWFLSLAAKRGFVVDSYRDEATGVMAKTPEGRLAITRITLRPAIAFSGQQSPTAEELAALHRSAHDQCFIANSLKSEVVVEAGPRAACAGRHGS